MVKARARAFRWRKMLDTGVHATIEDLAKAKRLAPSYVSGILRLRLLAPEMRADRRAAGSAWAQAANRDASHFGR
jgi:hypothetical protein